MLEPILVLGSSGHASVVADAIQLANKFSVIGFLDDTKPVGVIHNGHKILGGFQDFFKICDSASCKNLVIAVGDNWWRRKVFENITSADSVFLFPIVKHPAATVSTRSEIKQGTVILSGANVGPQSQVQEFCILNTGSSIDHDCKMSRFSSIAPGTFTGGLVEIGECSHVGVGASISDRKKIGQHSVVGTGAVVVRDIPDLSVAYGNPARVHRSRTEGEKYF